MTEEFSTENLTKLLVDIKAGKREPYIKSEPIPTTNDEPVKIAVAKNFDDIVYSKNKDTFLILHAPWCSYCKDLEPVIHELGKEMIDEDIEIIKFDAMANEIPAGFEINGYPTLFWLPKNSKFPGKVVYKGEFKLENFIKLMAERATKELKRYDRSGNLKKTEL